MNRHPHRLAALARANAARQVQPPPEPPNAVPSTGEALAGLVIAAGLVACAVAAPLLIAALLLWRLS